MQTKTRKPSRARRTKRIRVGDRIIVRFATRNLSAVVIEDRGDIGVGGRQLIRIRARLDRTDPESDVAWEVPAEEVRLVSNGRKK